LRALAGKINIEITTTTILHNLPEEVKSPVRETSVDWINKTMEHASSTQTQIVDGRVVRVLAWYDNEWGFSNRMADTAVAMGKLG
jgi:glyceraldehyde-3-phosphate dehydrogenase/erythrose-4-phosphate dehydrogenase